jgi:hypothetical protein
MLSCLHSIVCSDVFCGLLHCNINFTSFQQLALSYYDRPSIYASYLHGSNGTVAMCTSGIYVNNVSTLTDVCYVPNGAACGNNQVCEVVMLPLLYWKKENTRSRQHRFVQSDQKKIPVYINWFDALNSLLSFSSEFRMFQTNRPSKFNIMSTI